MKILPAWSPDGKNIAYFSDASGEYALHIKNQDGSGDVKKISLNGSGFYSSLTGLRIAKKLCFIDNGRRLYLVDVSGSKIQKIAEDSYYIPGAFRELFGSWSADSKHIAYTTITETILKEYGSTRLPRINLIRSLMAMSNVTEPVFDPSGKYLYLLASTDAGPVVNWFDQSSQDMEATNSIYLVTLQKQCVVAFGQRE